jgi:tetratricopeptide (TPR) repeat protein
MIRRFHALSILLIGLLAISAAPRLALALPSEVKPTEDKATENARRATQKYNEGTGRMHHADSLMAREDRKGAMKEYERAIRSLTEAVDLDPKLAEAWNNLGYSLRVSGRYEEALKHYDRAIELKPDLMQAHEYRARAYLALDRLEDARKEQAYLEKSGYKDEAAALQKTIDAWVLAKAEGHKAGVEKNPGW